MIRLGHLADAHLGHRQYGLRQREDDMVSTTRATLQSLVDQEAEAILLPGDLFHTRDLRPKVLDDAQQMLGEVPDDVPVLVSRGNHDENLSPRNVSWLNYLHRRGDIVFLEADLESDPNIAQFVRHEADDPGDQAGFYDVPTDLAGGPVRVFGLQWRGARTDTALEKVARGIRDVNTEHKTPAYTVLLAHFGIEDEVPSLGGTITHTELEPVKEAVDYLALGHIHKRYDAVDWIYNPGSPEAHNTQEGRDDWEHGCCTIDLSGSSDPEAHDRPGTLTHEVTHHKSKRRPYYRIDVDVTPHESPGELQTAFKEHVRDEQEALDQYCDDGRFKADDERRPPILDLRFKGTVQFDRADLRTDGLASWAEETCRALYVQVNTSVQSADVQQLIDELDDDSIFVDGRLNTAALERRVFETIAAESEYSEHTEAVADVLEEAHTMAQGGEDIADIENAVSDKRRSLFPDLKSDVMIDVPEDPFTESQDEDPARASDDAAGQAPSPDGGAAE